MKKLKDWLNIWIYEGKNVRGVKRPTVEEIHVLIDIAYGYTTEFINAGIIPILDKCGIHYEEHGVGWIIKEGK